MKAKNLSWNRGCQSPRLEHASGKREGKPHERDRRTGLLEVAQPRVGAGGEDQPSEDRGCLGDHREIGCRRVVSFREIGFVAVSFFESSVEPGPDREDDRLHGP